jgi:aldose 1-epimerase
MRVKSGPGARPDGLIRNGRCTALGKLLYWSGCGVTMADSHPGPTAHRIEATLADGLSAWILHDDAADLHATWVPEAGMLGASLVHGGQELLWQGAGVGAYASSRKFMGIPFLHPWANRLDHFGYEAGGWEVVLDPDSPLLKLDDNGLPIHGILTASPRWSILGAAAGADGARLVAGLEFDEPELLSIFPFAHRLEMDVRLSGGALEVELGLTATGERPVPVAFGFHPYLQLVGAPRSDWVVAFPVRRQALLDERNLPTGDHRAVDSLTGAVGERTWDDCFDRLGHPARFEISGGGETVQIDFAEGFPVAQIFAPPGQEYLCVEPMSAPVNSLSGPDRALTWVQPGHRHTARFRIDCRRR